MTTEGWARGGGIATAAVLFMGASAAHAAALVFDGVVMSGLANPRGMTFGPDGGLYVAEAGAGGDGTSIVAGAGETVFFGASSAISRWLAGEQTRVITGLPSLAGDGGFGATGAHDVAFSGDGMLYATIGFGADPALRDDLSGEAGYELLGQLVSISGDIVTPLADLAAFELSDGPDDEPNSNPFSLVTVAGGFAVTDAGGNDLLSVSDVGVIEVKAAFLPVANPLPFGPPFYQAVPTGAAAGAGGQILVGQLTGFPFPVGAANVFGVDGSVVNVVADGFTNLIDVAYGLDGSIYALELDSNGLAASGDSGSLFKIGPDGAKSLLFGGLAAPTGLAIGDDGRFYVAENGLSPTDGRVIALALSPAPVPLPPALPALATGIAGFVALGRQRSRRR